MTTAEWCWLGLAAFALMCPLGGPAVMDGVLCFAVLYVFVCWDYL